MPGLIKTFFTKTFIPNDNFKKKYYDTVLETHDGTTFLVCKDALISRSEYFRGMFEWISKRPWLQGKTIKLDEFVRSRSLKLVLEYVSSGGISEINLNFNSAFELEKTADFLIMHELKELIDCWKWREWNRRH